jgi:hypothetical protein
MAEHVQAFIASGGEPVSMSRAIASLPVTDPGQEQRPTGRRQRPAGRWSKESDRDQS